MNELMYKFRDNNVRVINKDNEPWFVMKDICEVLDIKNAREAFSRLEEHERGSLLLDTLGGKQNLNAINEYGLYSLIFTSRKPEAKDFKNWVTREVLPSIRKNGMYATAPTIDKILSDPEYGIRLLQQLQAERNLREEEVEKRKVLESKVSILTHVNRDYNATEIAKELGFTSASAFNSDLQAKGIQFKQNGTWLLYSKYSDKGYVNIKQDILDNGKVVYNRRFTQTGREWLLDLYKK